MKRSMWLALFALLVGAIPAFAETVTFDGQVSMEVPAGYTALSDDEIALKFPAERAPKQVVGNAARNTSIAFTTLGLPPATPEQMPQVLPLLQGALQKAQPGMNFTRSEVKTINGRPWLFYEIKTEAIDTGIHNLMLMTPGQGKWVGLNFNSTQAQYPAEKAALDSAIASVKLVP